MPTAMLVLGSALQPPPIADDLRAAGLNVYVLGQSPNLVQDLLTGAPDMVIMLQDAPDSILFETATTIARLAPRPVLVFTLDHDAENIARALASGIHAYVVNGYSPARLRPLIHLARARFQRDQLIKAELAQVNRRFEERKLVDRAKGILMGARQLREEEAYRVLRRAAMHNNQRIGQISQHVIDAAHYGEAINRAGQLRMLSQRLVKCYALAAAGLQRPNPVELLADSLARIEDTLASLGRSLSQSTFGDLLEGVTTAWQALKRLLTVPADPSHLHRIDVAAETFLYRSEQLTDNLEVSGFATALHVINVAGRQRMLSQRLAKASILAAALTGPAASASRDAATAAAAALTESLDYLRALPLTNPAITADLAQAQHTWVQFQHALSQGITLPALERLAMLSEALLEQFDRLTTEYERAMQAFAG